MSIVNEDTTVTMTPEQIKEICEEVNDIYGTNRVKTVKAVTYHFNDNISETFICNIEDSRT